MKDFCIQLQIFFLDWRNTVYPFNVVNSPVKDREVLEKKTVSLSDMWCQKKKITVTFIDQKFVFSIVYSVS